MVRVRSVISRACSFRSGRGRSGRDSRSFPGHSSLPTEPIPVGHQLRVRSYAPFNAERARTASLTASYDRAFVGRGDVTLWVSPEAIATWESVPIDTRGAQWKYSDVAIETALTLRLLFHLPFRPTEGFLHSIFGVMDIDLSAPDHMTLSRRGGHLDLTLCRVLTLKAFISSSTVRGSRSSAKVKGPPQNTAGAAREAGRSAIWRATE